MIGLDFPIRPEWVHDIHDLWQPEQPVSDLVQTSVNQTMQELGGEKTCRNTLSIILRNFVYIEGHGGARHTASQDVWVSFSRTYPVSTMTPTYLAQIIAQNEVAQEATRFLTRRFRTRKRPEYRRFEAPHYCAFWRTEGCDQLGQCISADAPISRSSGGR